MFNKYKLLCFIGISLISIVILSAQSQFKPGYIITINNDTTYGFLNTNSYKNLHYKCEFKESTESQSILYSPNEITAFRINDNMLYVTKEIELNNETEKVFLEYLVHGIVNLYLLRSDGNDVFFIEKEGVMYELSNEEKIVTGKNGEKYKVNSNQYKGRLSYLFQESPESIENLKATSFRAQSLIEITKDYHENVCSEFTCIDYTKSNKVNLSLEVFGGYAISTLGLKTSSDKATDNAPYIGFNLILNPSRLNKSFDIWSGISFSKVDFDGNFLNILNPYDLEQTYRIQQAYTALRIPIGLNYTIPSKKISPFFSVSYVNTFLLNFDYKVERINYFPDTDREISRSDVITFEPRKYHGGFSVAMGFKYKFQNNSYTYLKGEYEYRKSVSNTGQIDEQLNIKSTLISAGYAFSLN